MKDRSVFLEGTYKIQQDWQSVDQGVTPGAVCATDAGPLLLAVTRAPDRGLPSLRRAWIENEQCAVPLRGLRRMSLMPDKNPEIEENHV